MLLGINWHQHVRNDEVRRLTKQPHLSAIVQSRRLSLFGHVARMPDETDAKRILTASPQETGRDHWNPATSIWTTQLTWLRTVHSGDWCPCSALRTLSGACQKWWWWWYDVLLTVKPAKPMTWAAMASKSPASSGKSPASSSAGRVMKSQPAVVRSPPEQKPDVSPVTTKPR